MKVKLIKDIEAFFSINYNIQKGDEFKVQYKPDDFFYKGIKRVGYMIFTKRGKALIVYNDEVEVSGEWI